MPLFSVDPSFGIARIAQQSPDSAPVDIFALFAAASSSIAANTSSDATTDDRSILQLVQQQVKLLLGTQGPGRRTEVSLSPSSSLQSQVIHASLVYYYPSLADRSQYLARAAFDRSGTTPWPPWHPHHPSSVGKNAHRSHRKAARFPRSRLQVSTLGTVRSCLSVSLPSLPTFFDLDRFSASRCATALLSAREQYPLFLFKKKT